jgi:hypothetical protein
VPTVALSGDPLDWGGLAEFERSLISAIKKRCGQTCVRKKGPDPRDNEARATAVVAILSTVGSGGEYSVAFTIDPAVGGNRESPIRQAELSPTAFNERYESSA